MRAWIQFTQHRYVTEDVERQWQQHKKNVRMTPEQEFPSAQLHCKLLNFLRRTTTC